MRVLSLAHDALNVVQHQVLLGPILDIEEVQIHISEVLGNRSIRVSMSGPVGLQELQ